MALMSVFQVHSALLDKEVSNQLRWYDANHRPPMSMEEREAFRRGVEWGTSKLLAMLEAAGHIKRD